MENKAPEVGQAGGEGTKAIDLSIDQLKAELELAKAELQKQREIKEQITREQVEKNQKTRSLKEEREALQAQLDELKKNFDSARVELDAARGYRERVEAQKKAQLDSLKAGIPEAKRSLVVEGLSVDDQLDYISKNQAFLFDVPVPGINANTAAAFYVPRPTVPQVVTVLTDEERSLIKGKLNEEAAMELKSRNPAVFQQFLKRK